MKKLDGKTFNVVNDNLGKLKQLFPEIFTEDKLDIDKLRLSLGENIEDKKKRYEFSWAEKTEAIQLAQKQTTGTLRPDKESSANWDTTQNLYIEGDNLEVLRLLQHSYRNKVKMIYIDPPYNTGKDFLYKDDFHDNIKSYKESLEENMKSNADTNGRYHTEWLNMMYPRLKLAKNLLKNDGILVVHIDEHEVNNLSKVLNEIFGEENNLGTIVWDKLNPKGDSTTVAIQHESILCYAKNRIEFVQSGGMKRKKPNALKMLKKANELYRKLGTEYIPDDIKKLVKKYNLPKDIITNFKSVYDLEKINAEFSDWIKKQDNISGGESAYSKIDEKGKVYQAVSMAWPNNKKAPDDYFIPLQHPITGKDCPVPEKGWRNPSNTMKKLLENDEIIFGKDETTQPRRKYLLENNLIENVPSVLSYGGSDDAFFKRIGLSFDNPKPYKLVQQLISTVTDNSDIILDFFSGSATTAHAVMELNREDVGKRRFILVQLPEPIPENSSLYKQGIYNICELGKERIKRSANVIIEQLKGTDSKLDIDLGFRVFKLDETNLKLWDNETIDVEKSLFEYAEPVKEGRSEEDVVYEIILKYGIEITIPIEKKKIANKTIYSVGMGYLLICLERDLTLQQIEELAKQKPARIVFYDEGFKDDTILTNAEKILKNYDVEDVRII